MKLFLLALVIIVFGVWTSQVTSNSPQDENIQTIKTVLEQSFDEPDQELKILIDASKSYDSAEKFAEYQQEIYSYYEKNYKPYFTEDMFEAHMMNNKLTLNIQAYIQGYQLEVTDIGVKEDQNTEGAYDFILNVHYKKGTNEGYAVKISGIASIYEQGKISMIRFTSGIAEFVEAIQGNG